MNKHTHPYTKAYMLYTHGATAVLHQANDINTYG